MWRSLLEWRWQQRLEAVIRLSVAYHDAAGVPGSTENPRDEIDSPLLRQLMHKAVAARRALAETEDALTRLTAGTFGVCEQCGTPLSPTRLSTQPEARYCERCVEQALESAQLGVAVTSGQGRGFR
jgi:RNA polymerase-binding transcription factor DksA